MNTYDYVEDRLIAEVAVLGNPTIEIYLFVQKFVGAEAYKLGIENTYKHDI